MCSATLSTLPPLIILGDNDIVVRFKRRVHNPLLLAGEFDKIDVKVPWLGNKPLSPIFGVGWMKPRGVKSNT